MLTEVIEVTEVINSQSRKMGRWEYVNGEAEKLRRTSYRSY